jgi:hypothetical protein
MGLAGYSLESIIYTHQYKRPTENPSALSIFRIANSKGQNGHEPHIYICRCLKNLRRKSQEEGLDRGSEVSEASEVKNDNGRVGREIGYNIACYR